MITFQMDPKVVCADMTFHYSRIKQIFYRIHNIKALFLGPHTSWSNRAMMDVRLVKKFLVTLLGLDYKNLDQITLI